MLGPDLPKYLGLPKRVVHIGILFPLHDYKNRKMVLSWQRLFAETLSLVLGRLESSALSSLDFWVEPHLVRWHSID